MPIRELSAGKDDLSAVQDYFSHRPVRLWQQAVGIYVLGRVIRMAVPLGPRRVRKRSLG